MLQNEVFFKQDKNNTTNCIIDLKQVGNPLLDKRR